MSAIEAAAMPHSQVSNYQVIRRLLRYMTPFNGTMFVSLATRVFKIVAQAALLGIAAASVGIYVQNAQPGVVNYDIIWTQVKWIALVGTIVGLASYLENYTGHYVAFRILAEFRDKFYYAMLPLAPARTAKLQSGDAVSRVMTDCERVEPFYAHTIAPAVAGICVPIILLAWCWTVHPSLVWVLTPFYAATIFVLPWLVARRQHPGRARHGGFRLREAPRPRPLEHRRLHAGRPGQALRRRRHATGALRDLRHRRHSRCRLVGHRARDRQADQRAGRPARRDRGVNRRLLHLAGSCQQLH
jgi:ABC-type multidrug transport system fused ATPase/permease subunit